MVYLGPADLAPQWALPATSFAMCNMLHVAVAELLRLRQIPRQHFKNSAHDLIKCNASCPHRNFPKAGRQAVRQSAFQPQTRFH